MPSKILIVEDEGISAMHLETKLESLGYESAGVASSANEAIRMSREAHPDLILMDIKLEGPMDGIQAGQRIQKDYGIPVVFLTAFSDEATVARARETAPFGYLVKPIRESALKTTIEMALEKHILERRLEDSNRDLEQFASIAAHDLKAPSRQVYLFLSLLLKEFGFQLDPKAHEYIHLAQDGARRMQALVDDLLEYSAITRKTAPMSRVDLNAVLNRITKELSPDIERKQVQIESQPLPIVMGNEHQLGRLFENLLSNAIKYNRNVPQISILSVVENGVAVLSVKDNGIGIPRDQTDRIFDLFKRLHPESDFPGTGIGLASCKKIAEIHGGRIWVDSQLGLGSTFFFSLPMA